MESFSIYIFCIESLPRETFNTFLCISTKCNVFEKIKSIFFGYKKCLQTWTNLQVVVEVTFFICFLCCGSTKVGLSFGKYEKKRSKLSFLITSIILLVGYILEIYRLENSREIALKFGSRE